MVQDAYVEGRWPVVVDAEAAYEAIRSINHRTIWLSDGLPAPAVYWLLAELKSALGYGARQALGQLGRGLFESLKHYDVYEDGGRDASLSVQEAGAALNVAAELAGQIGTLLDAAQSALAGQGYRWESERVGGSLMPAGARKVGRGVRSPGLFPDGEFGVTVAASAPGAHTRHRLSLERCEGRFRSSGADNSTPHRGRRGSVGRASFVVRGHRQHLAAFCLSEATRRRTGW
ncbi:MAG: hypothetical protein AAGC63_15130 [Propionicimonas sp.]|nr:hypothetical protein [Propionicimonas sp.]